GHGVRHCRRDDDAHRAPGRSGRRRGPRGGRPDLCLHGRRSLPHVQAAVARGGRHGHDGQFLEHADAPHDVSDGPEFLMPSQAVAAGAVTVAVVASLPASYQIGGSTSWVTAWQVTAKTAAGFTVNFATPAPAGGGTFDWGLLNQIVTSVGLGTVTLADYLTTLRRLLHDPNDDLWSSA